MKNKINKLLKTISLILVVSLIMPMFAGVDMQEVQAAKRLQGIQKIVNRLQTEKFTILEIVPDKAYASFGYFVAGYEPQIDGKLIQRFLSETELSLPETPVSGIESRKNAVQSYFAPITTVAEGNREAIAALATNYYREQLFADENTTNWNVISAAEGKSFYDIRQGMYISAASIGLTVGDYKADATTGAISHTPGVGDLVWIDTNADGSSYQVVQFSKLYYKTSVASNDWFEKKVLELGGVLDDGNNSAVLGPISGYKVEVITLTPAELEQRFNTATENALELKDIDLVYLSDSSCLALPTENVSYTSYDKNSTYTTENKNDISWETAYNIFEYIVNISLPVIVDDSITPKVTTSNNQTTNEASTLLRPNNNIFRLAYLLKNYTEEYSTVGTDGKTSTYRYTINQYRDGSDTNYRIPNELPADDPLTTDVDERETADTKLGTALSRAAGDYAKYVAKLANKTAAVYASVYINASGKNIVHSLFSRNPETLTVGSSTISNSKVYGAQAIVDDIYTENFYYNVEAGDVTTEFQKSGNTSTVSVSDTTLLKYILNFNNRRIEIYKDKIRVLDIEPTKYSTLTVDTVKSWITGVASQKIQEIEIVQTTTKEFIGKLDDLNEEYDLIYFGSCIGNGGAGSFKTNSYGQVNYNDDSLDGMIYTHVGDTITIKNNAGGMLSTELDSNGTIKTGNIETRYSGNDITETKVKQLMEYVSAGYPVVISSAFYDSQNNINKARVDKNSYMYEFMNTCVSSPTLYPSVLKETSGLASVLSDYINMPKINLSLLSKPDEYAIVEDETTDTIKSVNYLQKLGNRNVLIYSFEFTNTLEDNPATCYQVQLYIDINADGQFDDTEELDSLDVMETNSLATVEYDELKPNIRYTVSRELPDDYVGITPWQIKVSRVELKPDANGNMQKVKSSVRTTAEGFTAVQVPKDKTKVVRVLQIASLQMYYNENGSNYYTGLILPYTNLLDDNPNDNVNKWTQKYYKKNSTSQLIGRSDTTQSDYSKVEWVQNNSSYVQRGQVNIPSTNKFTNYFNDLKAFMGFDIQVDVISVNDYVKRAAAASSAAEFYQTFYANYDMIIMGFEDCYQDIANAGSVEAIDMFIKSGRSVLFSHDTTSYFNVERGKYDSSVSANKVSTSFTGNPWYHWGYYLNQYIRSDVGMDRYGVTEDSLSILKAGNNLNSTESTWKSYVDEANKLNKEVAYHSPTGDTTSGKDKTTHEVHGLSDPWVDEYKTGSNYYNGSNSTENHSDHITQVNKGQITTYPYNINIEATGALREQSSGYYQMKAPDNAKMQVANTHAQYYQLDMNIDKDNDGNADMVVWYCLSDNRNSFFPNDVRNSYYIYSVGNVTYTGMGHYQYGNPKATGLGESEAKLFINTIIASLNSGKKDPGINIISDSTNKNSSLSYVYRTYDQNEIVSAASNVELYFYPSDVNIVNGRKDVLIDYFYEVPTQVTGSQAVVIDNKTVYLMPIPSTGYAATKINQTTNETITGVTLSGSWVNSMMEAAATSGNPFKVYISAQTKLTSSQNANEYTLTGTTYDYVTFKQRNLFDLD